ncbi:hypothetical protein [Bailinhaonella thermotolerans]|uniref:Uncharacterized protein n=1 Tax=Bailinhaonella thermotolerans TaxID=1070861 RepID=A0A3A4A608_9ACTN|nr:hypothetical protein [Bailinhaonella thermotolerans]RJL21027.1 hypothetical protein D5H75_38080 [Bailinhaonella thermotolerans]
MPAHPLLVPDTRTRTCVRWQLHCPRCHSPDLDREPPGPDHRAVTLHPDRDEYHSPIGTRGGYVHIALACAYGHEFAVVLANHKGAEYLGLVVAP